MNKIELIHYWIGSSDRDYITMMNLFNSGDFHWSLFMGHLVIEKLLKAAFLKKNENSDNPPKSHDLTYLADKAGIKTDEVTKDILDRISAFNINARYPDYKQEFYKKCTKEFTSVEIEKIKEIHIWLKRILEKE